jgi:hypothetical protein
MKLPFLDTHICHEYYIRAEQLDSLSGHFKGTVVLYGEERKIPPDGNSSRIYIALEKSLLRKLILCLVSLQMLLAEVYCMCQMFLNIVFSYFSRSTFTVSPEFVFTIKSNRSEIQ